MAVPVKIASCFGVLEYWSVGKSESPNFNLNWSFHYSITPADCRMRGKSIESPSGGNPKLKPLARILYICHVLSLQNIALVLIVKLQRSVDKAKCEMSNDE